MSAPSYDFQSAPGYLVRRAHQLHVALFMEETARFEVTPVQFGILHAVLDTPGEDQVTLAARVALDAATSGAVMGRLEARGLLRRTPDAGDRRRKLLWITPAGETLALEMKAAVARAQARFLATLDASERQALMGLLGKLVTGQPPEAA